MALFALAAAACALRAANLSVDYLPAPYPSDDSSLPRVSDLRAPRLGWLFASSLPGAAGKFQSAYRIQVASSAALLAAGAPDVWDSGVVASNQSVAVAYGGPPRPARALSAWRVEVWDEAGASCGAASEAADFGAWEAALLAPADWAGAQWLAADPPPPSPPTDCDLYQPAPAPLFRADVSLAGRPPLRRARAYVAGLGYYTLLVNGAPLPQAGALDPGFTSFNKTILYAVQDATAAVAAAAPAGAFTVAVALGNGWWNPLPLRFWGRRNWRDALATGPPVFRLALYLDFADGSQQVVVSSPAPGAGWRVGPSEVLRNNIYLGTVVNRSAAPPVDWALPSFAPRALLPPWRAPVAAASPPPGALRAATLPPVRRQPPRAAALLSSANGTHIYDAGVNMAGVCEWCGVFAPGQRLYLRYGEVLYANGSLNGLTSVAGQIKAPGEGGPCAPDIAWQADEYHTRGDAGGECYAPPFTWHGFRYIEVSGSAAAGGAPPLASLQCFPMRSDLARTSAFASSSALLGRIHAMEVATQEANLMSVQSDCPHRERLGYGGDALMSYESTVYNFDMALFAEKRARDFADAALPGGGLPETAPSVGISDAGLTPGGGPIGWQAYMPIALALGLRYHGNDLAARELYGAVGAFIALLRGAPAERVEGGLGDWMALEPSPLGLTGWGFAAQCHGAYGALARALGDGAGAAAAAADAAAAAARINAQYLDPATPGLYRCLPGACASSAHFNNSQCGQALALHLGVVPPAQRGAALALLAENLAAHGGHLQVGGFGVKYLLRALGDGGRADLAYAVMAQEDYPSYGFMLASNATTIWESWGYSDSTFSHNHPMFSGPTTYIFQSLAGVRVGEGARGADALLLAPQPPPASAGLQWANSTWVSVRGAVSSDWAWRSAAQLQLRFVVPFNTRAEVTLPLSGAVHSLGSGEWLFTDTAGA